MRTVLSTMKKLKVVKGERDWTIKHHVYQFRTQQNQSPIKDNIATIMALKKNPNGMYATWLVSNCHATEAAKIRFKYAQELVSIGLKLDGFGSCFHRPLK